MPTPVRAPFPWFGGKSRVAHLVWDRFGDVPNYVEPFAGSLAVLLARPTSPRVETVNDKDCYLANFWRAVAADPESVAQWADWPINEADLHARHRWLVVQEEFRQRMKCEPDFYDPKIAGWWVWGICQWIGSGWCVQPEWTGRTMAGARARGLNTTNWNGRPDLKGGGIHRKRPNIGGHNDKGVHAVGLSRQVPQLRDDSGSVGQGIHASGKMPQMDRGGASRMATQTDSIIAWMLALQDRLRRVRVCCGEWDRVLGPSPTVLIGTTAVFLDPPYDPAVIAEGAGRYGFTPTDKLYGEHEAGLSAQVREWAIEHGDDPQMRIALCGYEGEHTMPDTWECVAWKAAGGYSNRGDGARRNADRERIWFSPHCLRRSEKLF